MILSEYGETLLTRVFVGLDTLPSSYWVALTTAEPEGGSTGSTITEPSGGYERKQLVLGTDFSMVDVDTAVAYNNIALQWITTSDWAPVHALALCTASTGGELVGWINLSPFTAANGTKWVADIGFITLSILGSGNYLGEEI